MASHHMANGLVPPTQSLSSHVASLLQLYPRTDNGTSNPSSGLSGGYDGNSYALRTIIVVLTSIAWYNALELNVLVFVTFSRYSGLYFWSLLVASWGVALYALGFLFKFDQIIPNDYISVSMITVGWWCMVTGQSVVLYSRLHLIVSNTQLLRRILWMIIINVIILHFPTTVLTFGSNSTTDVTEFVNGYTVMEKIQMTGFCIQESILSGLYLWESAKFLKEDGILKRGGNRSARRMLNELFYINLVIIVMDLSLLAMEYANLYILEIIVKGVVYSVKLKLELAILNKLVQYVKPKPSELTGTPIPDTYEFIKISQPDPVVRQKSTKGADPLELTWVSATRVVSGISVAGSGMAEVHHEKTWES